MRKILTNTPKQRISIIKDLIQMYLLNNRRFQHVKNVQHLNLYFSIRLSLYMEIIM